MAPVKDNNKSLEKSLNEIKKEKQERKKWKEQRVLKKLQKQAKAEVKREKLEDNRELSTVSIAIPGSILENAQTLELRTYLAGQIARAACIFQIDEVVVFDDYADEPETRKQEVIEDGCNKLMRKSCAQLGAILQYLECPQYLRKHFFPLHNDLKLAGICNPLDAPHHLRSHNVFEYREGVVTNKPVKPGKGSFVNVGFLQDVQVDKLITEGFRCTVKLDKSIDNQKKLKGIIVSPKEPRKTTGIYWGYSVRYAKSISEVFSKCPYKEGYDLTIGTSDKGSPINDLPEIKYNHSLIMFGGLKGLEYAVENDNVLNIDSPEDLFDHYVNVVNGQGSRTIRTEEAVLIALTVLQPKMTANNPAGEFTRHKEIAQSSENIL